MSDTASPPPAAPLPVWRSGSKYETLVESIDEGFCVIEVMFDAAGTAVDYRFVETNPSFERQTGLHDAVGRTIRSLAPAHEDHWFVTYGRVAANGEPIRFEAEAQALGRWYDVYAFRVGEPAQHLVAVLFNDITPRKALEQSIEQQNLALREADLRKDRFLATLSHELRNPLAPLKMAADLLVRPELAADELAQARTVIRRQVGHMARLLDDLLDVARITQGKLTLRPQWVRPAEVIDGAIEAARPLIERKGHRFEVHLDADARLLHVDPVRLSQVVVNLLTNAAKYTDASGHITLHTRVDGEHFVVQVQDDGIGIAADAMPALFEMFSQVHGDSERSEGGLGIGLSLVKGLLTLHGGHVQAESDGPGRGSRFSAFFPLGTPPTHATVAAPASSAARGSRKVLVADDNRDAAEVLAMLLSTYGHDTRVAFDGHAAVDLARSFQPDVALLDIGMPGLDGYGVVRVLRTEPWADGLMLIAMTGWGGPEARRQALDAGFDLHLTKPVSPEEIERVLAR
jgi:signal transduction histidine kinase/CheY-like chemotaxis protein